MSKRSGPDVKREGDLLPPRVIRNTTSDLARKTQGLASLLDGKPPEVQHAFQVLLATAMHEPGKFELLNVAEVDARWHYILFGAGEVFSVVRPEMDKQSERQVREMVGEILAEEGLQRPDCRIPFAASRSGSSSALPTLEIVNETAEELTVVLEFFGTITVPPKGRVTRAFKWSPAYHNYKAYIPSLLPVSGQCTFQNGFHYTWTFGSQ